MAYEPTYDTPQEREDKAGVLDAEVRRFRWEVRISYLALFVIVLLK
jgi:hypothetical protein